jgi:prefoldin subunit 5
MADIKSEIGIETRYNAIRVVLNKARQETMNYTKIASNGGLAVDTTSEGYVALQVRISALEARLAAADAAVSKIQGALGAYSSVKALREAYQSYADSIQGAPIRAMDLFRIKTELAHERGLYHTAMPSELPALLSGYQTQEDALKAELVASQAAITSLAAALATISTQSDVARAALA